MDRSEPDLTELLRLAADGDSAAASRLFTSVYAELRRIAAAQRARIRPGETLDTTAVLHEAYLKLVGRLDASWNDRHHFFCTAARAMRDLLVDEARRRAAVKRGGDRRRLALEDVEESLAESPEELIDLDLALQELERRHPEDHEVVMLRYFGGLTLEEAAETLGISRSTAARRWRFCRSWLAHELGVREAWDE